MSKDSSATPDTNFDTTYGSSTPLIPLRAWSLLPSSSTQQPITLEFDIPIDMDITWAPTIDLKLFIANTSGVATGSVANMRLRVDLKNVNTQLGVVSPATGFGQTITSGDITVTPEPAAGNLNNIRVSLQVSNASVGPRYIAIVAIDRVATTGTEYTGNIYLASAVFRYRKLLN